MTLRIQRKTLPLIVNLILVVILFSLSRESYASDFPKVKADIKTYDEHVATLNSSFKQTPANPKDKTWVKSKLQHMVDVDQYMRNYSNTPHDHHYTEAENQEFNKWYHPLLSAVDTAHTSELGCRT